ncbi:hypothetical protein QMZ92_13285 [Streptomyces sp. HNM0645]|uniref:hypothetical protein n=1 Tax=Streptomyces sp. HNM0645 TaxID=2782343 RepID=UPI0024B6A998|nr:hypothetical protein [Streptomyces sp. HNM0645]MDI9885341.1 hypothetical protein [Streptomyces sp. HNM0645]
MSTDEQATRASGSVPHAYGNALAWRWSREMPTALRRGFLTLLYALRAMANANGELRFPDKPIRIQDIAKAAAVREKDARRYLDAAIAAGVVAVKGERRRGKPTLYTLMVTPMPDWGAAEKVLSDTRRQPGRGAAPWQPAEESSGHRGPNQIRPPRPKLPVEDGEEVRATAARMGSGHRGPNGSGHRGPNNPGTTHESSHDGAGVVFKPQVVGAAAVQEIDSAQEQDHHDSADPPRDFTRCARCHERMVPRPGRTTHAHCTPEPERTAS